MSYWTRNEWIEDAKERVLQNTKRTDDYARELIFLYDEAAFNIEKEIEALFAKLRKAMPDVVLRTSLICGLPGEGEAEFEELCHFLREQRIQRAGVFQFSPEEGTLAAAMEGQVDPDTAAPAPERQSPEQAEHRRPRTEPDEFFD